VRVAVLLALTAIAIPVAAQRQEPGPKVPFEDEGACPLAGCAYGAWVATSAVPVRNERRANASVTFQIAAGETVTSLTGVVVTTRSGRVGFRRQEILTSADGDLEVQSGELLHLLASEGGGFWTAWFKGRVFREIDGGAFSSPGCKIDPSRCPANILQTPQFTWWVQVRNAQGQIGWTNEPDKFDGRTAQR
jgi:hypothetical protein